MDKYYLNPAHINDQIITKTEDGTEILINKHTFNDYFGELLLKNGQHHLVSINPVHESGSEKKTFHQITEDVILLTENPLKPEEKPQSEIVKEQESKRGRGRPQKPKE